MRRIFASGFRAGFVLSFRWIPFELNSSDKGSRFFDSVLTRANDFFMFLHIASHGLDRHWACDHDCLSPSLVHLDVGEVHLTSHIHAPTVSVQSYAPSDDLSYCAEHAVVVSSQRFSGTGGRNDCTGGFGNLMYHVSLAPLTWCALPLGLVGSQLLDAAQMQWSSAGNGTDARHAQSHTEVDKTVRAARFQAPPPDGGFEKSDEFQQSREAGTRCCARSRPARRQRGGQRNQRRKRAITCADVRTGDFQTTTQPPAHSGRAPDVSRWKVGRIAAEANSCGEHSQRDGVIKPLLASSSNV